MHLLMALFVLFSLLLVAIAIAPTEADVYSGCNFDEYYADIIDRNVWSREELTTLLQSSHRNVLPYTRNREDQDDVWRALMDLDAGTKIDDSVQLIYKATEFSPASTQFGTADSWNREHLWPKSRGVGSGGADFVDVHHLRPSDWNVNAARNNLYFGNCSEIFTSANSECRSPAHVEAAQDTAKNSEVFLPPAQVRGDIARAMFYMELRYGPLSLTDCPLLDGDSTQLAYRSQLLQWHKEDDVDDAERARNDRVCRRWQGNRNPFVDRPQLVDALFGQPKSLDAKLGRYTHCSTTPESMPSTAPVSQPSSNEAEICESLKAGDVQIIGIHSDNPDLVALVALVDLPGSVRLFLSDGAWTGSSFQTNEGTIEFTVPSSGISEGTVIGYSFGESGQALPYSDQWRRTAGQFSLSTGGDNIFLFCRSSFGENFLAGISFTGEKWLDSGIGDYATDESSLPDDLSVIGAVVLPHFDNYVYVGPRSGTKSSIIGAIKDVANWQSSDDESVQIPATPFSVDSGGTGDGMCKTLRPGNVQVVSFNSDNPDSIVLVSLADVSSGVDLYMTDRAWTGSQFAESNEGTIMLTVPSGGIATGQVFGYSGDTSSNQIMFASSWERAGGGSFSLSTAGDSIIIYCQDGSDIVFLCAVSFNGKWDAPNLDSYGTDQSALPVQLGSVGSVALVHMDNYVYVGSTTGDRTTILDAIMDPINWLGSNSEMMEFGRGNRFSLTGSTASGYSVLSLTTSTVGLLIVMWVVLH